MDQFVTLLKNKVKSCEYSLLVDDMVQDKFVFSIPDLQVKERLLREEKLTLEKAISIARASEASKEHMKVMGQRSKTWKIQPGMKFKLAAADRKNPSCQLRFRLTIKKVHSCGSSCPALGKTCDYNQRTASLHKHG